MEAENKEKLSRYMSLTEETLEMLADLLYKARKLRHQCIDMYALKEIFR